MKRHQISLMTSHFRDISVLLFIESLHFSMKLLSLNIIWYCVILIETPHKSDAAKKVYFYAVNDQFDGTTTDPVSKLVKLVIENPKARHIRFALRSSGMRSDVLSNILFDRKKKTITFHSVERGNDQFVPKYYYRFYNVDAKRLRKWQMKSNQQDNTYSRDLDLFLLPSVGCRVKDLRINKFVSVDELPNL